MVHTLVEFTSVLSSQEGKPLIGHNILLLLINKKINHARTYLRYILHLRKLILHSK